MRSSGKCTVFLPIVALVLLSSPGAGEARAGVSVNINIGPPPIVVAEPPAVVMVPESRVCFVPDVEFDVFFYAGYWWSPRGDRWYRARAYNGPWVHMAPSGVPRAVVYMPRDYRARYARGPRYPYGQWKMEYPRWEKEQRQAHRRWEKEREKEWKRHNRNDRYEWSGPRRAPVSGPHAGPGRPGPGPGRPGPGPGGPGPGPGGPGPGPGPGGPGRPGPGPGGPGPGPGGPGPGPERR
jgi:hypothetical protein